MLTLKLTTIGKSAGLIFPKEALSRLKLQKGDTLFLYTDGLSESLDGLGNEYGMDRLSQLLTENKALTPNALIELCRKQLNAFAVKSPADDLTLMAIQRTH